MDVLLKMEYTREQLIVNVLLPQARTILIFSAQSIRTITFML